MHGPSSGSKVSSLSRPSTQQTQNQRIDSKIQSRGSTGSLPTSSQAAQGSKSKQDGMQQRPPVTRGTGQAAVGHGSASGSKNRDERYMGKREGGHAGGRGGSQQHRQASSGADHRNHGQKQHGTGDAEGSTNHSRSSINQRRASSKNHRDSHAGSQV